MFELINNVDKPKAFLNNCSGSKNISGPSGFLKI